MKIQAPIAIEGVASIPWKNRGGTTRQLAVHPADATAEDFHWRISIARIDAPGNFSAFPGIDHTILLWRGDGVKLRSSAWPDRQLNDARAPFHFRGEDEVVCDLLGGPTQDLNLMVQRGRASAMFEVIHVREYEVPACDDFILLCASGSAQFNASDSGTAFEISANQFVCASEVRSDEAVVRECDKGLLVAIAIRTLS